MVGLSKISRALVALGALLWLVSPAAADPIDLTRTEIRTLLNDNTAIGTWQGQPYRQYFRADGDTIYAAKGQRSTLGKWRTGATFETWWDGDGWKSWGVARDGDTLLWTGNGITPEAFLIVPGAQLLWPK